jgi:hypothetical protein
VVVFVMMADEDGDAVLVMVSMDWHFDIVRLALFDGGGRQVEWEAGSSARDKWYLRCDLGKYRSSDGVDKPSRREEGGKVWREMHVGEEEMGGTLYTRERRSVIQRRLERQRQGMKDARRVNEANQSLQTAMSGWGSLATATTTTTTRTTRSPEEEGTL